MDPFLKDLTTEQKCAVIGVAVDFAGVKTPTVKQLTEISGILANIADDLGVSKADAENFVHKMEVNGRLSYAIKILKTLENSNTLRIFYCYFYSVIATLGSHEGLEKLNMMYKTEFGYDDDDIQMLFELFEIKKF